MTLKEPRNLMDDVREGFMAGVKAFYNSKFHKDMEARHSKRVKKLLDSIEKREKEKR